MNSLDQTINISVNAASRPIHSEGAKILRGSKTSRKDERIEIIGLMLIPPLTSDPSLTRREFSALRKLRDELSDHCGLPLTGLSMGMSNDYEMAIEEGATAVRVGSSIFGDRKARKVEQ